LIVLKDNQPAGKKKQSDHLMRLRYMDNGKPHEDYGKTTKEVYAKVVERLERRQSNE